MSRIIKLIDNETIEIADYRNPEVIFKSSQNPPTLQNTRDEIEHLEWYCTFKDTINPFQIYEENHRLHSIIKEVREYIKFELEEVLKVNRYDLHYHTIDGLHIKRILEILDKENI